jgi:hypothetical protein
MGGHIERWRRENGGHDAPRGHAHAGAPLGFTGGLGGSLPGANRELAHHQRVRRHLRATGLKAREMKPVISWSNGSVGTCEHIQRHCGRRHIQRERRSCSTVTRCGCAACVPTRPLLRPVLLRGLRSCSGRGCSRPPPMRRRRTMGTAGTTTFLRGRCAGVHVCVRARRHPAEVRGLTEGARAGPRGLEGRPREMSENEGAVRACRGG